MASPRPNKRKKLYNNSENNDDVLEYQSKYDNNNIGAYGGGGDDDDISDSELVRASQILESKLNYPNFNELSEIHPNKTYMSDMGSVYDVDIKQLKADNFQKTGEVKMLREKYKKLEQEMNKLRNEKTDIKLKINKQTEDMEKTYKKQIESKELEIKFKTQEVVEISMKYKSLESRIRKDSSIKIGNEVITEIKPVIKQQDILVRKMKLKTKPNSFNHLDQHLKNDVNESSSLDLNTYYYQLIDKFKNSVLHFNSLYTGSEKNEKTKDYLMFEKSLHELNNNINNLLHKVNYSQRLNQSNQQTFQISSNLCKNYMNLVLNSLNQTLKNALATQISDTNELFINISYLLLEILINLSQYETLIFSVDQKVVSSQYSTFNLKHELSLLISHLLKSSNSLNINVLNCILVVFNQLLAKSDSNFWLQLLHNSENKNLCLFYIFFEKCTKFFLEESYKCNNNAVSVFESKFIFNFLSFFDLYISKLSQFTLLTSNKGSCLCKKDMITSFSCIIDYLTIKKYLLADNLNKNGDLNNNYLIFLCKLIQLILLINNSLKLINDDMLFEMVRDDYRYKNFICLMMLIENYLPKRFKHLNFNNVKTFLKSAIEIYL
jgi:hypothetical protein